MSKSMRRWLRNFSRSCVLCSALAVGEVPELALADDSSCKVVLAAQAHQISIPYHSHSTITLTPGKTEPSEEISTGKALYIRQAGKWTMSPITPAQIREQQQEIIKSSKLTCRAVRDETVDGVSATLYSIHTENDDIVSDDQIWISKSSGLPVSIKTEGVESHYVYTDVVAPSLP